MPRTPSASPHTGRGAVTARPAGDPGRSPVSRPLSERQPLTARTDRPSHLRPYDGARAPARVPPYRGHDHRYNRPYHRHIYHHHIHYAGAFYSVPGWYWYAPYYSRWWCHPYWRYTYSTSVVVGFGFSTYAWVDTWVPPARAGWVWVPGYYSWGWWHPGYWRPAGTVPVGYHYVPGYWQSDTYVEGYYRRDNRDGWEWIEGQYLDDGTYEPGHWAPLEDQPDGYTWVPGFFDGEVWIDGFWRPEERSGFAWVNGAFDEDGIFHAGHWMPLEDRPGEVWVPGWFDGNTWIEGYWIAEQELDAVDPEAWEPDEGYDAGWDEAEAPDLPADPHAEDAPLALPVDVSMPPAPPPKP